MVIWKVPKQNATRDEIPNPAPWETVVLDHVGLLALLGKKKGAREVHI